MKTTDILRRQHKELIDTAEKINRCLDPWQISEDPSEIHDLLLTMSGELMTHLAMEDKGLYPVLLKQDKPEIKQITYMFINEMGELRNQFEHYLSRWSLQENIRTQSSQFIDETKRILQALQHRIDREENELFNKLDKPGN
jgi:iron-sulfur cluster repair protein YtfE (RIC family)